MWTFGSSSSLRKPDQSAKLKMALKTHRNIHLIDTGVIIHVISVYYEERAMKTNVTNAEEICTFTETNKISK